MIAYYFERVSGWGPGIHYSLKIQPIIHLIKILGYSLKLDQLFIKVREMAKKLIIHYSLLFFSNSLKKWIIH